MKQELKITLLEPDGRVVLLEVDGKGIALDDVGFVRAVHALTIHAKRFPLSALNRVTVNGEAGNHGAS